MEEKCWLKYENKWKFRNFYFKKILRNHFFVKYLHKEPVMPRYAHKYVYRTEKTNQWIINKINSGDPFFVTRYGGTEMAIMTRILKRKLVGLSNQEEKKLQDWIERAEIVSGLFPSTVDFAEQFTEEMKEASKEIDLLGMWHLEMEDYVIEKYAKQAELTHLLRLEPWFAKNPWSASLEGKRVLVIHPFEETILEQYKKRVKIFPTKNVLPEFDLITMKAVQSSGGEKDERFNSWFEALEFMYQEAIKKEFDIAILGCGAYGLPLGAKLKKAGKQVIHLGGATQLLFGIRGSRWDHDYPSKINQYFNEYWVYPSEAEKPKNAKGIENACYWK